MSSRIEVSSKINVILHHAFFYDGFGFSSHSGCKVFLALSHILRTLTIFWFGYLFRVFIFDGLKAVCLVVQFFIVQTDILNFLFVILLPVSSGRIAIFYIAATPNVLTYQLEESLLLNGLEENIS